MTGRDKPFRATTGSGWQSYTPVLTATTTNPVLNNGTLVGRYLRNGSISFYAKLTIGSTTTIGSGIYQLTIPTAPAATANSHFPVYVVDASTGTNYWGVTGGLSGVRVNLLYDSSLAAGALNAFQHNAPVTVAVGDTYEIWGEYEPA